MGDWIKPRVRLRRVSSAIITQVLLQDVRPTKSARETAWESEPMRISQRLSIRSDRRPVANDVSPQMQADGSMISPAWAASKPSACCKKSARMRLKPKLVNDSQKLATAPRTNCPLAKTCKFTIGAALVHSAQIKASRLAPPMTSRVRMYVDPQP